MTGKRNLTPEQRRANVARAVAWARGNRERRRANQNRYYARHRVRILAEEKAKRAASPKKERSPAKGRDPEKAKIRRRRWQTKNRDRANVAQRKRRAENLLQMRASEAIYREKHADQLRENQRRWHKAHPGVKNCFTRRRRALKRGAAGSHTSADIDAIRAKQKDRCAYCRSSLRNKGHVDHIVALSKGGSNWPRNLQLLCVSCNSSKHDRDAGEFMRSRGRLL